MLNTQLLAPHTMNFSAVLEVLDTNEQDGVSRCRVYHKNGWCDAWTWLPFHRTHPGAVLHGDIAMIECGTDADVAIVLGLNEDPDPRLSDVLPGALCPIPGIVTQTAGLIDGLRSWPLRRFLTRALLANREALAGYWLAPASRRDHHAFPGGLAQHSLQVATMVQSANGLPPDDREIGIAYSLVHDYGKIWCYEPIARRPVDSRCHEALGLAKLNAALADLEFLDPRRGAMMRELLGGPRMPRALHYPLAIGRIVRAFDQMSCELTRRVTTSWRSHHHGDIPF